MKVFVSLIVGLVIGYFSANSSMNPFLSQEHKRQDQARMQEHDMRDTLNQGPGSFDERFIDMMIPHHRDAIVAAQMALEKAERPELKQLAREIITAQQKEIQQMETWKQQWQNK